MNDTISITGTVATAPTLTTARLVEFVVVDDHGTEFAVRAWRDDVTAAVRPGATVTVHGAAGWVIPGRSWRHEPSRTIVQASSVETRELALAA
ncbi:hypothetical protein ITJ55_05915 [Frigoribacterium sp. VKM Ac-1396]|jgi:hypothetical protein|uniref:hypothetical protein n=1 Tax=Frigoribacterium sp. VKM Ac-1396 TaxID=2783821 RepID=UPI00188BF3EA|nr:hypothetical protein [Frigoribacterium sp. VKM Ac-1396]MBF4600338.1 hypothetical protein [Frigoribacterium sp. VKM Ac-1396]